MTNCNNCNSGQLLSSLEVRSTHLFCSTHVETVHNNWGCELHQSQTEIAPFYRYAILRRDGVVKDVNLASGIKNQSEKLDTKQLPKFKFK